MTDKVVITGSRGSKTDQNPQTGLLRDVPPMFPCPCSGLAGMESATSSGMWEPAQEPRLPAGLWAAPGEGKAASSAPASSHLVNTINNVILAACTSLWRARRELTELQLETGLRRASAAAPKHTVGLNGTQTPHLNPAPIAALAAQGAGDGGDRAGHHAWQTQPAHGHSGPPLTLIPSASCSEAQEKCMMDTRAA